MNAVTRGKQAKKMPPCGSEAWLQDNVEALRRVAPKVIDERAVFEKYVVRILSAIPQYDKIREIYIRVRRERGFLYPEYISEECPKEPNQAILWLVDKTRRMVGKEKRWLMTR